MKCSIKDSDCIECSAPVIRVLQQQFFDIMYKNALEGYGKVLYLQKRRVSGVKIKQDRLLHPGSLSFVPPMLPPFLLPSSLHALSLPLPGSSIVKAGFSSSSSLSCRTPPRSASYPASPSPTHARHPVLGSGEGTAKGKESASNCRSRQQNKAALT